MFFFQWVHHCICFFPFSARFFCSLLRIIVRHKRQSKTFFSRIYKKWLSFGLFKKVVAKNLVRLKCVRQIYVSIWSYFVQKLESRILSSVHHMFYGIAIALYLLNFHKPSMVTHLNNIHVKNFQHIFKKAIIFLHAEIMLVDRSFRSFNRNDHKQWQQSRRWLVLRINHMSLSFRMCSLWHLCAS